MHADGGRVQCSKYRAKSLLQVHIYFPEIGHPAFGIVRAIVKDSLDVNFGLASQTFLDSDGQVCLSHHTAPHCLSEQRVGMCSWQ